MSGRPRDRWLVAIDVDGTLLDTEFEDRLRPREIAALDAVRRAGHLVALCTGRNSRSMLGLLENSGWEPEDLPLVLLNGAVVRGGSPCRQLARHVLDRALVQRLVEIYHEHGALAMVYGTDEDGGIIHCERRATNAVLGRYLAIRRHTVGAIAEVDDLVTELPPEALEVGTIDRRDVVEELTAAVKAELDGAVSVVNTRSLLGEGLFYWAESYAAGCSKGEGARLLAREHGVRPDRIVALGDNFNDLSLFEVATWSVAMAGAPREVRDRADHVASAVQQSGGAAILEEIAAGGCPPRGDGRRGGDARNAKASRS